MSEKKTDNQYLEELVYQAQETRRSLQKTQGNTFILAIISILSLVASAAMASRLM